MTEAQTEEVVAGVGHRDQAQLGQGEEQVERQGGDEEGEGDTRQDQRHPTLQTFILSLSLSYYLSFKPLVPLLLLLLSLRIRGEAGVDLEKLEDLQRGLIGTRGLAITGDLSLPGSEPRGGQ